MNAEITMSKKLYKKPFHPNLFDCQVKEFEQFESMINWWQASWATLRIHAILLEKKTKIYYTME